MSKTAIEVDNVSMKFNLSREKVPLLELGAGFDPQYTGKENIYLYGAMLGYTKKFIDSKYDEIVEFSELQKFMDVPVKNYSCLLYTSPSPRD